jgi:hypothetical protein
MVIVIITGKVMMIIFGNASNTLNELLPYRTSAAGRTSRPSSSRSQIIIIIIIIITITSFMRFISGGGFLPHPPTTSPV